MPGILEVLYFPSLHPQCYRCTHPDDVVGDVDVGVILEFPWIEVVVVVDEGNLNATEVGVKDVAINEQVRGEICLNEEKLRCDLHATIEVSASALSIGHKVTSAGPRPLQVTSWTGTMQVSTWFQAII